MKEESANEELKPEEWENVALFVTAHKLQTKWKLYFDYYYYNSDSVNAVIGDLAHFVMEQHARSF